MAGGPLEGVRVLDFTRLLPGPLCTMFLGDMGADVIKVEDTEFGDYIRRIGRTSGTDSAYFHQLNRNKRSLKIDYRSAAGRDVVHRLAEGAQIVIEGFRPGTMAGLGLGYDDLAAINPALVYCSLSGFGQTGPLRDRAGHDMNYAAYAGLAEQVGDAEGPPANSNFQFADIAGGTMGALMSILGALYDAQRTGSGRYLDASITDCAFAMTVIALAGLNANGRSPERGNELISGRYPWYRYYATSDGKHVHLGALEWRFWRNFCEAVGHPEWTDKQLAEGAEADAIAATIADIFAAKTRDELVAELAPKDTCVAPVLTPKEAAGSALFRDRSMLVDYRHPTDGAFVQAAFPVRMTGFEFEAGPAPGHGEHSRDVLREAGLDKAEIEALAADGVI